LKQSINGPLTEEGVMNKGKLRSLNAQLEQQVVNFLSLKIYNKIGPHHTNLLTIDLA